MCLHNFFFHFNFNSHSVSKFLSKKMGEDEISSQAYQKFTEKLESDLDSLQTPLKQLSECLNLYSSKMQDLLNAHDYSSSLDLAKFHQNAKNEAISQVRFHPSIRNFTKILI